MSEFKVGDRVRIRDDLSECEEYSGTFVVRPMLDCRGQIATIEAQNDDRYLIDLDNHHWDWTKEMFEPIKNQDQQKIEELEQRIEKLEKFSGMGKYATDRKENVSNFEKTTQKSNLLSEDERVILSNVDEEFKWIIRNTHQLTITERKPKLEKWGWGVDGGRLADLPFRKLFKFIKFEDDEPYNIEELLKGECGNE